MASILETQLKNLVHKGFKGRLLVGTLRRVTPSSTLDSNGDPTSKTLTDHSFEGFVDTYSEFYRAVAGVPDTKVKVVIISGSLTVVPKKDDYVKLRDTWYQVLGVTTDPALATWELPAFAIETAKVPV